MPAKLFRIQEITVPGTLPAGRYVTVHNGRVVLDVELDQPTNPRALIPLVKKHAA